MGAWGRLIPCQGCPLVFYSHLRSELTKKTRAVGKHFTLKIHLKKAYHLHLTDEETEAQRGNTTHPQDLEPLGVSSSPGTSSVLGSGLWTLRSYLGVRTPRGLSPSHLGKNPPSLTAWGAWDLRLVPGHRVGQSPSPCRANTPMNVPTPGTRWAPGNICCVSRLPSQPGAPGDPSVWAQSTMQMCPGPPPNRPSSPGRLGTVGPENCSSRQIPGSKH